MFGLSNSGKSEIAYPITGDLQLVKNRPIQVLILDDSPDDISYLRHQLSELPTLKTKVAVANSVKHGIRIAKRKRFDIAIVDFVLQRETGTEFVKELGGKSGRFPCILTTGLLSPEVMTKSLETGVMSFLDKNLLSPNLLESTIQTTLLNWRAVESLLRTKAKVINIQPERTTEPSGLLGGNSIIDLQEIVMDVTQNNRRQDREKIKLRLQEKPQYVIDNREKVIASLSEFFGKIKARIELTVNRSPFFDLSYLTVSIETTETLAKILALSANEKTEPFKQLYKYFNERLAVEIIDPQRVVFSICFDNAENHRVTSSYFS